MTTRDGKGADLQRSLALLWEGGSRGQRGPRPRLTVERIAHAAIGVADADGLEALSMQRIAAELGCSTMAIYNHIPGKDLLLEVVADVAAGRPPRLDDAADFRDAVRRWAAALWTGFQTRPWLLRVPIDHTPVGPNQLAWLDRLLQPLLAAGLVGGEARAAALHLTAVVRGVAQISADTAGARGSGDGFPRDGAELARALAGVVDPLDYPALAAVHAAELAGDDAGSRRPGDVLPAELGFGVDRFLDGVESWTAAKARRDG
jgi:AcrR family transcriptional regulator